MTAGYWGQMSNAPPTPRVGPSLAGIAARACGCGLNWGASVQAVISSVSGVRRLMEEWPVIWIERSRGWASAAESTAGVGPHGRRSQGVAFTAGGACGHVHGAPCLLWPCAWCSMSSGPTEGCLVLLFCWFCCCCCF